MFRCLSPGAVGIGATFEQGLRLAAETGFDALDVPLGEVAKLAEEKGIGHVKKMFEDAGVKPGGWGLPVQFRTSEEEFEKGMQGFPRLAKIAGELGSPWCATWILPFSDKLDYKTNFELHARRLRAAAKVLRDHGCRLGLEFVGPWTMRQGKKYPFVADMAGMLHLAEEIGTGNVGLLLDCWHWYTAFGTVKDILRLRGLDVVYVHMNDAPAGIPADEQVDNVRALPGATGVIDAAGFLKALDMIGYDGPVVVEPFSKELSAVAKENPAEAARRTAEALNKVWKAAGLR
jgi:sugar phosphate isomerase/epimerase